jgi:hypothetical protein
MPKGNSGVSQAWQDEGWHFLDTVGELAFANQWIANALSRVELQAMEVMPDGTMQATTNVDALAALNALFYGESGQAQMLHTMGIHLTTPGETYLVGVPPAEGDEASDDLWRVLSNKELRQQGSQWIIDRGDGVEEKYEDGTHPDRAAEALVIRIWRPHPAKWVEATSPVRAALPILRELENLTKATAAILDSRLAGSGLLVVPMEASLETPLDADQDPRDPSTDPFMTELTEMMLAPLRDRGVASSAVPGVLRVPGDLVDKVKHLTFWSELSEHAQSLREEQIHRLALSMDMPPEELTGKGEMNHWGGWLATEDGIKLHIEPLVGLICDAITQKYYWPSLMPVGADPNTPAPPEVRRFVIIGDTSNLRQRPDRSADAIALHKDLVLTDAALARETGFEPGDILDNTSPEFNRRLLMMLAGGITTGDQTQAAIKALGINLTPEASAVEAPASDTPTAALPAAPAPPTPAIEAPRNPPEPGGSTTAAAAVSATFNALAPQVGQRAALLAASELLVTRALERANSRLFGRGKGKPRPVTDEAKVTNALHDAWTLVPVTAAALGIDPAVLLEGCDRYTRELLGRGVEHHPDLLAAVLDRMVLGQDAAA